MLLETPVAVMVHVGDPVAGLAWYEAAFKGAKRVRTGDDGFEVLVLGGVQIEIVASDAKLGSGPCGSVVYWAVSDFDEALRWLLSKGATLYRGPLTIENDQRMCQVQDPWGNCIGLRSRTLPERRSTRS